MCEMAAQRASRSLCAPPSSSKLPRVVNAKAFFQALVGGDDTPFWARTFSYEAACPKWRSKAALTLTKTRSAIKGPSACCGACYGVVGERSAEPQQPPCRALTSTPCLRVPPGPGCCRSEWIALCWCTRCASSGHAHSWWATRRSSISRRQKASIRLTDSKDLSKDLSKDPECKHHTIAPSDHWSYGGRLERGRHAVRGTGWTHSVGWVVWRVAAHAFSFACRRCAGVLQPRRAPCGVLLCRRRSGRGRDVGSAAIRGRRGRGGAAEPSVCPASHASPALLRLANRRRHVARLRPAAGCGGRPRSPKPTRGAGQVSLQTPTSRRHLFHTRQDPQSKGSAMLS